jgi:hypothetical protein
LESEGPVKVKLYHSHVARLNHYLHTTELCTEVTARMKPLWLPLVQSGYFGDKAWRSGEEGTVELGPEAKRALKEVHVALARSPGISVLDIVQKVAPQQESVINYHLGGDACVGEDTQDPGVAGSLHGVVWRWKLEGQEKRLPITTLEFSCLYGNVEMLMPLVPMESSEITFHSDAATAVFDMAPGKVPDSEMMAFVAQRVRSHPEVCKREGTIFVTHCRGDRNQIDDAVSRGYTSVLDDITRQLNMSIRMVELTPAFKAFTHELVALHVRLEVQGQALKQGMKPREQGPGETRMSAKRRLEEDESAESTVKKRQVHQDDRPRLVKSGWNKIVAKGLRTVGMGKIKIRRHREQTRLDGAGGQPSGQGPRAMIIKEGNCDAMVVKACGVQGVGSV